MMNVAGLIELVYNVGVAHIHRHNHTHIALYVRFYRIGLSAAVTLSPYGLLFFHYDTYIVINYN